MKIGLIQILFLLAIPLSALWAQEEYSINIVKAQKMLEQNDTDSIWKCAQK